MRHASPLRSSHFYPRPPRGGRHDLYAPFGPGEVFLSTPSARRATRDATTIANGMRNFYPRPPRGGRPNGAHHPWICTNFYPRPPRGGRRAVDYEPQQPLSISIHALREEGDFHASRQPSPFFTFLSTPSARRATRPLCPVWPRRGISIHALREEGDPGCHDHCERYAEFLSTPSARRATQRRTSSVDMYQFLSTPSARRATATSYKRTA